jgi:hypothetical protein
MKNILLFAIVGNMLLASCGNKSEEVSNKTTAVDTTLQYFGDTISQEGAIAVDKLVFKLEGKDSLKIKLTGTIADVCQKKGCWMNMNLGDNQIMRVSFKDYGFFVPKDAAGKTVVIEGVAFHDTTSVADLQHYAEDAGKSEEEIKKITEPEINIEFEANGVIIKK